MPINGDVTLPSIINATTGVYSQSYNNWQYGNRDRDELIASTTYFIEAGGSHTLKAGINLDQSTFSSYNNTTGTAFGNDFCNEDWGFETGMQCGARLVTRNTAAGNDQRYYVEIYSIIPEETVESEYQALYAQDEWRPIPSLTARLGLRYERSEFTVPGRSDVPSLSKLQPRLGLAWDIFNNAQTIVHGFWGQVMDDNALTLADFGSLSGSSIPRSRSARWSWAASRRTSSTRTRTSTRRWTAPCGPRSSTRARCASPAPACLCRSRSTTSSWSSWWSGRRASRSATRSTTTPTWGRWSPPSSWRPCPTTCASARRRAPSSCWAAGGPRAPRTAATSSSRRSSPRSTTR